MFSRSILGVHICVGKDKQGHNKAKIEYNAFDRMYVVRNHYIHIYKYPMSQFRFIICFPFALLTQIFTYIDCSSFYIHRLLLYVVI